jgi:serine/threonine protein kinase
LKSARFLQPFFNLEVKTCPKSLLSIMHLLPLYIARHGDASRDVDVAIKELSGNRTSRENQMLTELTALNRVPHPNILENFGFAFQPEPQPRAFLVFPFMAGGTLTRQLNVEAPDAGWRLRVAFGVASALTVLHAHGIVHRDVKSRNILIDADGSPKLGDGGEARQMRDDQTHATTRVIGTPDYLDPEYGDTEQLRDTSDVFSLGVVMLELLTGRPAYRTGMTPSVILWRCFRAGTPEERRECAVA